VKATHCDGPECDTWRRDDSDLPNSFLTVVELRTPVRSFCSADCLLKFYAQREPIEVIHGSPGF
jgi:hypothetical protein